MMDPKQAMREWRADDSAEHALELASCFPYQFKGAIS